MDDVRSKAPDLTLQRFPDVIELIGRFRAGQIQAAKVSDILSRTQRLTCPGNQSDLVIYRKLVDCCFHIAFDTPDPWVIFRRDPEDAHHLVPCSVSSS